MFIRAIRWPLRNLLLAATVGCLLGCRSVPPPPSSANRAADTASLPPDQINPLQAVNRELAAIADGDPLSIRAWEYCDVTNAFPALDACDVVVSATAQVRKAFDKAYGAGRLRRLCPAIVAPGKHYPAEASVKIEGDHATVSAPGWDEQKLIRVNNVWKQDLTGLDWAEVLAHFKQDGCVALPVERLVPNLQAMAAILNHTAAEIENGEYKTFAEAFGVLNARLRGRAYQGYPLYLAFGIDFANQTAQATASPVPITELRGDPTELGMSHGKQLGDSMRSIMKDYFGHAFDLSNEKGRKTYELALKIAARFERRLLPEHREEIRALAASVGVDPAQAMLGQCFADLNPDTACSTVSFPAGASSDGIARFGRNLDYTTFGILNRNSLLLVFHPKDRYAFASVSPAPGLIGVLSGMNEHGLSLAVMEVPRAFRLPHAMPCMLLYRAVLENCKTVDEAIALLEKTPRQSANNLMLMDASGARVVVELTPSKVTVRRARDDAALISTNHQRGNDFDSPGQCHRFDYLHDASQRHFGQLSETGVEELLAGATQGEFTFQSMVFEPANRVLYLALGAGAPSHGFQRIDLKPLFN
jgi:predicted choloylglycine hydrolase